MSKRTMATKKKAMPPPVLDLPVELEQSTPLSLLNLPVDIILEIADLLSSWLDAVALTVTCRALFYIFEKKVDTLGGGQLQPPSRAVLLGLLEKEHGGKYYYCQTCNHLHRFSQAWHPTTTKNGPEENSKEGVVVLRRCQVQHVFNPNPGSNGYNLSCAHARLVMNRHLRGAPHGLPMDALSQSVWTRSRDCRDDGRLLWRQDVRARIVGDELLLRVCHLIEGKEENLERDVADRRHRICNHVVTGLPSEGSCREEKSDPDYEPLFIPGRGSAPVQHESGWCHVCPTQYNAFIWRARNVRETRLDSEAVDGVSHGPTIEGQRMVVFAYHNLGGCRDDQDWTFGLLATGREKYIFEAPQMTFSSWTLSLRRAFKPSTLGAKQKWLEGGRDLEAEALLSTFHYRRGGAVRYIP